MGSNYKKNKVVPVTTLLLLIGIFWYLVAIPMNSEKVSRQFKIFPLVSIYKSVEQKTKAPHPTSNCDRNGEYYVF